MKKNFQKIPIILAGFLLLYTSPSFAQVSPEYFLNILAGKWQGEGKSFNTPVKDELEFSFTLNKRFLSMNIRSVAGDQFSASGYLWYNNAEKQFEFYEFSTGQWPVRKLQGGHTDSTIVLEEKTADRHVRLTFTIKSSDLFVIEEAYMHEGVITPFVRELFTRIH